MGLLDSPCKHCDGTCDKMIVAQQKPPGLARDITAPLTGVAPYDEKVKIVCRIEVAMTKLAQAQQAMLAQQSRDPSTYDILGAIFGPDSGRLSALDPSLQRVPRSPQYVPGSAKLSELERIRNMTLEDFGRRYATDRPLPPDTLTQETSRYYDSMAMTDPMFGKMWFKFKESLIHGPGEHLTESVARALMTSTQHLLVALHPRAMKRRAREMNRELVETMDELVRGLREAHSRGDINYVLEALEEAEAVLSEVKGEQDDEAPTE